MEKSSSSVLLKFENQITKIQTNESNKLILAWSELEAHDLKIILQMIKNTKIRILILSHNNIGNEGCEYLCAFLEVNSSLMRLDVSWNHIGDDGCKYLVKGLETNTSLQKLDIWNNQLTNIGCQYLLDLLDANKTLKEIDVSHNPNLDSKIYRDLYDKLRQIHSTCLKFQDISPLNFEDIQKRQASLTQLIIKKCSIKELPILLNNFKNLVILDLSHNKLTEQFWGDLCDFISHTYTLREFHVQGNKSLRDLKNQLRKALSNNFSLIVTDLSGTKISESSQNEISNLTSSNASISFFNYVDTPILRYINDEDLDELSYILDKDVQQQILILSCMSNKVKIINHYLNQGFDINYQFNNGNSFLHYSCMKSCYELTKYLFEMGINEGIYNNNRLLAKDLAMGTCRQFFKVQKSVGNKRKISNDTNPQKSKRKRTSSSKVICVDDSPPQFENQETEIILEEGFVSSEGITQEMRESLQLNSISENSPKLNLETDNITNPEFNAFSAFNSEFDNSGTGFPSNIDLSIETDMSNTDFVNPSFEKNPITEETINDAFSSSLIDSNIESISKALIEFRKKKQKEEQICIFDFISESVKESICQMEKWINSNETFEMIKELSSKVKPPLLLEKCLSAIQQEIKQINSIEELKTKSVLLATRDTSRKEFVEGIKQFNEWINSIKLQAIKEDFQKKISLLETLFEIPKDTAEVTKSKETTLENLKNTLIKWNDWKERVENCSNTLKEKIEAKSEEISSELLNLSAIFKKNNDPEESLKIDVQYNFGKNLLHLQQIIEEEKTNKEFENLKSEIPLQEIRLCILQIYEIYKLDVKEIEDTLQINERLKNAMELENEWYGIEKPASDLDRFNEINKEWEHLDDQIDDIENDIRKLKKKKKEKEQEITAKERELKEVKAIIRNLTKEKEKLMVKLARLCIQFFPELQIENPKLNLEIYFQSEGLERNRKLNDYEDVESMELEGGSKNKLYKVKWENETWVLKCFELPNENSIKLFRNEIKLLNKMKHPNFCEFECYFIQEDSNKNIYEGFLQMPFYEGGQLDRWIRNNQPSENKIRNILKQILQGLDYLHANDIIHCDIKPQTILMTKEGTPKISHFDTSKDLEGRKQALLAFANSHSIGGTMHYMAPEVFKQLGVYKASDIYSFGLIVFDIYFPNINRPHIAYYAHENKPLEIPNTPNINFIYFLNQLLKFNPIERITARQALADFFFVDPWEFNFKFVSVNSGWEYNGKLSKICNLTNQIGLLNSGNLSINDPVLDEVYRVEFRKLEEIFFKKMVATSQFEISRAYAIQNDNLKDQFFSTLHRAQNKVQEDPNSFKNELWRNGNETNGKNWREWILNKLNTFVDKFPHNKSSMLKIIPLFHIVKKEEVAKKICETGFSPISIMDDGWFGKGIYFTTNLSYGTKYHGESNEQGEFIILLTFVFLGNVYPVIENPNNSNETLKGSSCKEGYDSYFTIVKPGIGLGVPCVLNDKGAAQNYTRVVIFQESQCLPKFLLFVKQKK